VGHVVEDAVVFVELYVYRLVLITLARTLYADFFVAANEATSDIEVFVLWIVEDNIWPPVHLVIHRLNYPFDKFSFCRIYLAALFPLL